MLINLALNARDAMGRAGALCVAFDQEVDQDRPWVVVTVTDTGCGMSPLVVKRIFDSYFTTKGANGSGLGLATVKRFADECGGAVSVDSTPGQGTTFRIRMPAASL